MSLPHWLLGVFSQIFLLHNSIEKYDLVNLITKSMWPKVSNNVSYNNLIWIFDLVKLICSSQLFIWSFSQDTREDLYKNFRFKHNTFIYRLNGRVWITLLNNIFLVLVAFCSNGDANMAARCAFSTVNSKLEWIHLSLQLLKEQ